MRILPAWEGFHYCTGVEAAGPKSGSRSLAIAEPQRACPTVSPLSIRRRGQAVRQRTANPLSPVRIRAAPLRKQNGSRGFSTLGAVFDGQAGGQILSPRGPMSDVDRSERKLTTLGLILSTAVLLAGSAVTYRAWPSEGLAPNEWGDLFAGVSAALAFLWLILGYIQQGRELRQNSRALLAQEQQLRAQVDETRELVELQKRSLELLDRSEIRPTIVFASPGRGGAWYMRNVGKGPAINIVAGGGARDAAWEGRSALIASLSPGEEVEMEWVEIFGALFATYSDAFGAEYTSECVGNRNSVSEENRYPDIRPDLFQYQLGRGHDKGVSP